VAAAVVNTLQLIGWLWSIVSENHL